MHEFTVEISTLRVAQRFHYRGKEVCTLRQHNPKASMDWTTRALVYFTYHILYKTIQIKLVSTLNREIKATQIFR